MTSDDEDTNKESEH
uniref:Uncharacterized protein n=1 Tax=Anguilla anguilla TaxID=7936 RepID=A0A0E9XQX2_ANGAN